MCRAQGRLCQTSSRQPLLHPEVPRGRDVSASALQSPAFSLQTPGPFVPSSSFVASSLRGFVALVSTFRFFDVSTFSPPPASTLHSVPRRDIEKKVLCGTNPFDAPAGD